MNVTWEYSAMLVVVVDGDSHGGGSTPSMDDGELLSGSNPRNPWF